MSWGGDSICFLVALLLYFVSIQFFLGRFETCPEETVASGFFLASGKEVNGNEDIRGKFELLDEFR